MLPTLRNLADDIRKLIELVLAVIMTPAVARTTAELIDAGIILSGIILDLAWAIIFARAVVMALEFWERYISQSPAGTE